MKSSKIIQKTNKILRVVFPPRIGGYTLEKKRLVFDDKTLLTFDLFDFTSIVL